MSTMLKQDRTLQFDTSSPSVAATTTTLAAAITTTIQQNLTLSAACGPNGTYIQIGSERMYILSGGSSTTPIVERGSWGTTAATHSNGATVQLPGYNTFTLRQIAEIPNQSVNGAKVTSDINYQLVVCGGSDTIPGGSTTIILADNTPARGTLNLLAPAGGTVWIQFPSAGAPGAAGSGSGAASLNLTFAGAGGVIGQQYNAALVATGGVPPFTYSISSGSLPSGLSLASGTGAITGTPTAAGNFSFTAQVTDTASTTATVNVTLTVVGVPDNLVSAVSAVESYTYQDEDGGVHEAVQVTVTVSSTAFLPATVDIWMKFDPAGQWYNQGLRTMTAAGGATQKFTFGDMVNNQAGMLWAPTSGPTTWSVAANVGSGGDVPPSTAVTNTFSVTGATACPATDVTSIQFVPNPTTGSIYQIAKDGNSFKWNFYAITGSMPSPAQDASFLGLRFTTQKGQLSTGTATVTGGVNVQATAGTFNSGQVGYDIHVGGILTTIKSYTDTTHIVVNDTLSNGSGQAFDVWNPAPVTSDDDEGSSPFPGIYQGRSIAIFSNPKGTKGTDPGTVAYLPGTAVPNWTYPPEKLSDFSANPYRTFRILAYAISRLGTDPSGGFGVHTRQTGWAGGADAGYLTPVASGSAVDATQIILNSLGPTLTQDVNNKPIINQGATLGVNASGQLIFFNIQSTNSLPTLPSVYYPTGSMVQLTTTSPPAVYQNVSNVWKSVQDPTQLLAGALASGATLAAAQLTAGTVSAALTISAPTINGGTINGSTVNLVSGSNSIVLNSNPRMLLTSGSNAFQVDINPTDGIAISHTSGSTYKATFRESEIDLYDRFGSVTFQLSNTSVSTGATLSVYENSGGIHYVSLVGGGGYGDAKTGWYVNGTQVISTRVGSTPSSLADVIAVLQHHGLSN